MHVALTGSIAPQTQILSNASVGAGTTVNFTVQKIDMTNFGKLGAAVLSDASHSFIVNVLVSPDGLSLVGSPFAAFLPSSASGSKFIQTEEPLNFAYTVY